MDHLTELCELHRLEISVTPDTISRIDRAIVIHPQLANENRESFLAWSLRYALWSIEDQPQYGGKPEV